MSIILEICTADPDSIVAAREGGADRVELCSALEVGGLSPSKALIDFAMEKMNGSVNVLLRPRTGDFCYSGFEKEVLTEDAVAALDMGVNGLVIGALNPDGSIDMDFVEEMVELANGRAEITFHRAFDMCRKPFEELQKLIDAGVDRILTSGLQPNAEQGITTLSKLVELGGDSISIMPGAGVNPENAAKIIKATGAHEIHASAKKTIGSRMTFRNESVNMGTPGSDEFNRPGTSEAIVKQLRQALDNL